MADDRHTRISEHAYRLWQQEGEPHGRDQAHWDEAERAFAGEGPVADEPDPQAGDAAAAGAPFAAPEQPAGAADASSDKPAAPEKLAPAAAAAKPVPAKKPAVRRKRTN
ncbi:hypothetical protein GCM10022253_14800 [Sphingomonas endophytica]|uniref:DUF2934 domain-containing protein n=1 Tax=Sphingomonas endophytica TaxID=869719 RepID=A0ABR6N3Z7_9SPHN|nr:DUF2934 domain-containing protein [Sphingomonas endophytica]MBB5725521.1 hypothetical protein [Sphingomonas endophytica]